MPQVSHSVPLTTNATINKPMPVEWVVVKKNSSSHDSLFFADECTCSFFFSPELTTSVTLATAFVPTKAQ